MRTPDTLRPSVSDPVYSIPMSTQSPIDNNVGEATRLTITMTVEVPSRKKIVYRAIQRRDGVIVEKPRYRPSSPEASTSNGGRSAVVGKISTITSKRDTSTTQPDWMGRMDEHLAGIGAFEAGERAGNGTGKDYSRSWLQCGRSGYNGIFHRESDRKHDSRQETSEMARQFRTNLRGNGPDSAMQRFLDEPAPWSPHRGAGVARSPL